MQIIKLIISVAVCFLAGFIGSFFTMPSIPTWYATLNKPFFNPPNWIFGPVWSTLYLLMGIAAYLIWKQGLGKEKVKPALMLFMAQLVLNSLWSIIFFGLHAPLYAFICIIVLWFTILITLINFYKLSKTAGWLLVPYICWVSFASILNLAIVLLNK